MHKKYQLGGWLDSSDLNTLIASIKQQQQQQAAGGGFTGIFKNPGINLNSLLGAGSSILGGIAQGQQTNKNSADGIRNTIFNTGNQIASMFGPIGAAAAGVNSIIDATGGFTSASKGLGTGNDILNGITSVALPGAGWFTKKTQTYNTSDALRNSSGYTGTAAANQKISDNYSNRGFLFGRNRANTKLANAKLKDITVNDILKDSDNAYAASQNVQDGYNRDQLAKAGNQWQFNTRIGRKGLKIESAKLYQKYANGGKMNIIPEGALHSRKHNLEKVDPMFKEVTQKGIPVINKKEDGGIQQHAEIERAEIIFTKEVSDKLTQLRDIGTEEAAIEAGKILAKEIMENTIDKTKDVLND